MMLKSLSASQVSTNREIVDTQLTSSVGTVGNVQSKVRCNASRDKVYEYLCAGAGTGMKLVLRDPVAYRVTLRSGAGVLSRGDTLVCTVNPFQGGCTVLIEGIPTRDTNIAADLTGTVSELATSLILKFGDSSPESAGTQG